MNNAVKDRDDSRNSYVERVTAYVWIDERSQPFCAESWHIGDGVCTATGRPRGIDWELGDDDRARGTYRYGRRRTLSWPLTRVVVERCDG